ncbi:hypothetical protein DFA_10809 [Cavenderia fasciculata]|uniref:Essential protein Yae1 N-terminal domain-containing protein n=1 Tax=Cavenderia fasciculata TaxID=261658 RepID=F4QBG3_CACFS|nr:uncharacterized protein DFA_10809 [Cavenderia fasciculata]EGG14935.1 hypothetical protein DFA_10809 [Cavenderia fasciculata]|eukprot:XP_004351451.1 hypothetical protein DFA_10809 [Cavenderia fasciculata]
MSNKHLDDDFYGSDDYDIVNNNNNNKDKDNGSREAERSKGKIYPMGYRDGLEDGKNQTLQIGFNDGLKEGVIYGYNWSLLLGAVSSVDVFFHHNKHFANEHTSKLDDLITSLRVLIDSKLASPSVDVLKQKFMVYEHIDQPTIVTKTKKSSNFDGCCGGSQNDDGCCKQVEEKEENTKSSCCSTLESCSTTTTTTTTTNQDDQLQQQLQQKQQSNLDEKIQKEFEEEKEFIRFRLECIEAINKCGLKGEQIINDCLTKKMTVKFGSSSY